MTGAWYRDMDCPNCGRRRVMGLGSGIDEDGVCEKCRWDVDGDNYATVTRTGARCVVCESDSVDSETGECRDRHWHGVWAPATFAAAVHQRHGTAS